MRTPTMTSRERVRAMFARRDQDRIPRSDSFWPETLRRWREEGLPCVVKTECLVNESQAAMRHLGNDFSSLCWVWPSIYLEDEVLVAEDAETRTVRDRFGKTIRLWKSKSGTPEHIGFGCDSPDAWTKEYKPRLLQNGVQIRLDEVAERFQRARWEHTWCHFTGVEVFEETRALMGDEITLMAMLDEPDWVADVAETFVDTVLANFQAAWDRGIRPDGVWIYGDMAYNHATMCSPKHYRELFWPQHKRLVDWAHERDLPFIYHTDGDVRGVLDLYLEAGMDCLQPLEAKASMDIRKLVPEYGQKLCFFGNIDVMILATNDLAKIEEEVRSKLAAGMSGRGYAYHSDHSVPPQVSWQTYCFVIELLDTYGWY